MAGAMELEITPGAVVVAGRREGVVFQKAYGRMRYDADAPPMQLDTIFDLASVSKSVGCATSIMILADRGKLSVTDPVCKYLPGMDRPDKKNITIQQCLLHIAGFVADNEMTDYANGPDNALQKIYASKLKYQPGTDFVYSDLSFIVLGEVVKAASGRPLNQFAHDEIFVPLKMKDTTYLPPASWRPRIAPTEKRSGEWIVGEVHDPRAYALGGFAGHAGLFGSAPDLARWCRMILGNGELEGTRIVSAHMIDEMTRLRMSPDQKNGRGYGLDFAMRSTAGVRGKRFEKGKTFGHTGYTGTMFWIDPVNDAFVVLLTNRVHPDDDVDVGALRRRVSTIVAEALLPNQTRVNTTDPAP